MMIAEIKALYDRSGQQSVAILNESLVTAVSVDDLQTSSLAPPGPSQVPTTLSTPVVLNGTDLPKAHSIGALARHTSIDLGCGYEQELGELTNESFDNDREDEFKRKNVGVAWKHLTVCVLHIPKLI